VRFRRPRLPLLAGVAVSIATNLNAISSPMYAAPLLAVCAYLTPPVGRVDRAFAQDDAAIKKHSHRSLREGMFDLTKMDFATVVMLGDSLTEAAQWSEITGCPFVANRGIGADDSAGVLQRVEEVIALKPTAVFLMIGINDVNSSVPAVKIVANVRQTIERLTKAGIHVYLTLVLPVAKSFSQQINPKVEELNAAYQELAVQTGASVVDFRQGVQTESGFLRDELSIDGVHLTPAGYRLWRDAVAPYIRKHCSMSASDLANMGLIKNDSSSTPLPGLATCPDTRP
jgi:lysophospholipase L1-like esterase